MEVPPGGGLASLAVLITVGAWRFWPSEAPEGRPGIAVLPFENYGGDEATGRLADGITEDIITDLARFRKLDVIARNSMEVYKGRAADIRQVGEDLGVGYVLEGSIQREGDRIRVTAQLIDARSDAHVSADRWDRPAIDVFRRPDGRGRAHRGCAWRRSHHGSDHQGRAPARQADAARGSSSLRLLRAG